ncbi:hypothetical protein FGO68_gene12871 [Halteria grandinella]|uniref:SET domain-containing protein n=1 Tax=Halteria grandinella TaxID=5974 RepID=A0A8J8T5I4_HALGN|nr:hypothetical protein FGO68_gene12871 [Halteria grandinella]
MCECFVLDQAIDFQKKQVGKKDKQAVDKDKHRLTALWIIFSFMNHSCNENTSRFSLGNYIFIRARRQIKQGEEITTVYLSPEVDYEDRQKDLMQTYGFQCTCVNCEGEKNLPPTDKRLLREITESFKTTMSNPYDKHKVYSKLYKRVQKSLLQHSFFMKEINYLQKQLLSFYASTLDEAAFLEVWNEYKDRIDGPIDVMDVYNFSRRFEPPFTAFQIVEQRYKEIFKIYYGSEDKLYKELA